MDRAALVGQQRSSDEIGQQAEAAEHHEHDEHEPDDNGVDADARGNPGAHPLNPLERRVAADPAMAQPVEQGRESTRDRTASRLGRLGRWR